MKPSSASQFHQDGNSVSDDLADQISYQAARENVLARQPEQTTPNHGRRIAVLILTFPVVAGALSSLALWKAARVDATKAASYAPPPIEVSAIDAAPTRLPVSLDSIGTLRAIRMQAIADTLNIVVRPGVTMGRAVAFIQKQNFSPNVSVDWMADSRQYVTGGNQLTISFGLALIVIFLVLAAQYESFRDPLVILVTVPLAMVGALIPLFLGFTTLNIYTQIGLVTLIGLISKHGILMVAFANETQSANGSDPHAAILEAASVRLRPILMTTTAMVAGLIPLVFSDGAGASSRFAIGIVVIMGMLIGTLFTLFVLPTFYVLLAQDHRFFPEGG
jgi:hypothetical protein